MIVLTPGTWYVTLESTGYGGQRWVFLDPAAAALKLATIPTVPAPDPYAGNYGGA